LIIFLIINKIKIYLSHFAGVVPRLGLVIVVRISFYKKII